MIEKLSLIFVIIIKVALNLIRYIHILVLDEFKVQTTCCVDVSIALFCTIWAPRIRCCHRCHNNFFVSTSNFKLEWYSDRMLKETKITVSLLKI